MFLYLEDIPRLRAEEVSTQFLPYVIYIPSLASFNVHITIHPFHP